MTQRPALTHDDQHGSSKAAKTLAFQWFPISEAEKQGLGPVNDRTTEMDGDLRGRVVALEQGSAGNSQRLTVLEAWRTQRDIDSARHDERWKRMDDKIDAVGKKVDKISEGLSRIMWTVIVAFLLAVVAFIVKGGIAP